MQHLHGLLKKQHRVKHIYSSPTRFNTVRKFGKNWNVLRDSCAQPPRQLAGDSTGAVFGCQVVHFTCIDQRISHLDEVPTLRTISFREFSLLVRRRRNYAILECKRLRHQSIPGTARLAGLLQVRFGHYRLIPGREVL